MAAVTVKCLDCGLVFMAGMDDAVMECPACHSENLEVE